MTMTKMRYIIASDWDTHDLLLFNSFFLQSGATHIVLYSRICDVFIQNDIAEIVRTRSLCSKCVLKCLLDNQIFICTVCCLCLCRYIFLITLFPILPTYLISLIHFQGTQSLNPHNDYCQHFVDTGHRPQNFIRDVGKCVLVGVCVCF